MGCCGPKLSVCGLILGVWGTIMLTLMGIFFQVQSPALVEDLPINEDLFDNAKSDGERAKHLDGLYQQASYNCFISAGMYLGVLVFSFIMFKLNERKSGYSSA
ncbi:DgyrCDS10586 [Dimorphilus gyrociliatus]|uniref:DgyrCDS10586 n=1 Tax=Dimorphilus gyrociliatus TaxID=2664684 RepID=A0A7I8W1V4_9ANNE|nr:DgyrCDS10586 [Dimorphilus gyrociliatus]